MKRFLSLSIIAIAFASCCSTSGLHQAGYYKVATRTGETTTFANVKGKYRVVSDTLKVGSEIFINVIKNARHK